jgi:hypothetical protein
MPLPQQHQALLGARQRLSMAQQVFGQDGGEVLGGGRHGHGHPRVQACQALDAAADARLPMVDQALLSQVRIEQGMDAPVRGFLADETAQLGIEGLALRLGQGLRTSPHRVHEELLTRREAHGQGIEESRAKCVAAMPVPCRRGGQIDQQTADDQVAHGETFVRGPNGQFQ